MTKIILFILLFFLSGVGYTQPNSNNGHLKQSFRYAKDVNPVDFLKLDPRVIEMIGGVAKFCKENNVTFMITSAIRDPKKNKEVKSVSTTHVEGRAIDFSIKKEWGWTPELIKRLEVYIERRYGEYGLYAPFQKQKVIVIHNANNGTGTHAHLQTAKPSLDTYTGLFETKEMIYEP